MIRVTGIPININILENHLSEEEASFGLASATEVQIAISQEYIHGAWTRA